MLGSVLVTVAIPADDPEVVAALTLTCPIVTIGVCFTSALNVFAVLTVPRIDLISLVLYAVDPTEIFPLSTPLKINCSPVINSPLVLYAVRAVPAFISYLKYPVAPLDFPLMWVGTGKVAAVFKVILV